MTPKSLLFPTIIQMLIQAGIWYLIYRLLSGYSWFDSTIHGILQILFVAIITYFISLITIFKRPIELSIRNINTLTDEPLTIIDIQAGNLVTLENQRTVQMTIELKKKYSVWWGFLLSTLKKYKIQIDYLPLLESLGLEPENRNNIKPLHSDGFTIELNDYLKAMSIAKGDIPISEIIEFTVVYDENNHQVVPSNNVICPKLVTYRIQPKIGSNIVIKLVEWIIKPNLEVHKITIKKR